MVTTRGPRLTSFVRRLACTALLLSGLPAVGTAQEEEEKGETDPRFAALEWTNIGPNRGGRSIAVGGSDSRPLEYWFGATGGGLWKTTDGGTTWRPVTDGQIESASVGSMGVCETNPDIIYIGTGETQLRGNIQPGDGVYKSTDGGETWTHVGLREGNAISRVRVHPTNCDVVFAGAFGRYGAPNPERGVYRSTDGGSTWEQVLRRDEKTGAADISIDPSNPDVIYASLWEAYRNPWQMSSGGPGSGLFKSTDGGDNWTELTRNPGLPPQDQIIGKIGVSVSPVDPNRVFAIVEADSGGVFRSDDGGATWTRTNEERKLRQRAFYYTRIYADTEDRDRVYVLNTGMWRSDDAGVKFETQIRPPHGDQHDLWIAPSDNQRMINGNDGGGNVSYNAGTTWTEQDYPTAQLYRVSTTHHVGYHVCGGQQDNSTVCVPTRGWDHMQARGPGHGWYYAVGGCESGYVANDPEDPNIFFSGCYGGALDRFDFRTGQSVAVNVWPDNPMGWSSSDIRERVQWTFPIVFSRTGPRVVYATSQHVWKTTDDGQSWERISPDLTRADPTTMEASGGPITRDQTGVETYPTVFALEPSHHDPNVIWAGTDDGLVQVTRDGGRNWSDVTPPDFPEFTKIFTVAESPHTPGVVYVAGHRMLLGDEMAYVYRTRDWGSTWTSITEGIPEGDFALSIREDTERQGMLYLATQRGIFVSFDDGESWSSLSRNLPSVQVSDIAVEDKDLVIATHGRSLWVMYDIAPLRQLTPEVLAKPLHLYQPDVTTRGLDEEAVFYYHLAEPADRVTLEILDGQGGVIRSFTGIASDSAAEEPRTGGGGGFGGPRGDTVPPTKAGLNRFEWDMRYPGYVEFPGMILWAASNQGPLAVPGRYQVRVTADGTTETHPFDITLDPRLEGTVTVADLQQRFDLAQQLVTRVNDANSAVLLIRGVKQQVDERLQRTDDDQIEDTGERVNLKLTEVEQEVYQLRNRSNQDPLNFPIKLNNRLASLLRLVESGESRPTAQMREVYTELSGALQQELDEMEVILDTDLEELNRLLRAANLPIVEKRPLGNVATD
jgi:photosystem II stability/assembly factor-like uncharacterized protein